MHGHGTHDVLMLLVTFVLNHSLRSFSAKMQSDIHFIFSIYVTSLQQVTHV
jgi:hypothetical protein